MESSVIEDAATGAGFGFSDLLRCSHEAFASPIPTRRTLAISTTCLALVILPTFTISQPSTPFTNQQLLLRRLWREILDDLAVTLDSSRVVDLLPEYHGGGRYANDLPIENFVSHSDEMPLVVRTDDHRHELQFAAEDAGEFDLVDEESRHARRTLSRLQPRRRTDQRLERIAASLRVVAIIVAAGRLLEDFLQRLLHAGGCRGHGAGSGRRRRRSAAGGRTGLLSARLGEDDGGDDDSDDQERDGDARDLHYSPPPAAGFGGF